MAPEQSPAPGPTDTVTMNPATRDIVLLFSTRITRLFAYGLISVVLGLYLASTGLNVTGVGAASALKALEDRDLVYVHVEAPDEAGHLGSIEEKVRAIERVDGMLGTIMDRFDGIIAVLPDHATRGGLPDANRLRRRAAHCEDGSGGPSFV